jgi:hypothetical protein
MPTLLNKIQSFLKGKENLSKMLNKHLDYKLEDHMCVDGNEIQFVRINGSNDHMISYFINSKILTTPWNPTDPKTKIVQKYLEKQGFVIDKIL